MRQCPFCTATLSDSTFACRKHWFALSKEQQAIVWKVYQQYLDDEIGIEELRAVQQRVIDEVNGVGKGGDT